MISNTKWTVLFWMLFTAMPGMAQDMAAGGAPVPAKVDAKAPVKPPRIVEEPGQPAQLVFSDGRVATVMTSDNPIVMYPAPFQVTENLCKPQAVLPHCTYEMPIKSDVSNLVWTTNPDKARLGQKIEYKESLNVYNSEPDDSLVFTNFARKILPALQADLVPDRIVCDRYDWLPVSQGGELRMKLWSAELMIPNNETQVNENQTLFMFTDLNWKLNGNGLVFESFRRANTFLGIPPLLDTSMMVVDDGAQGCQLSIASSLALIQKVFTPTPGPLIKAGPNNLKMRNAIPNQLTRLKSLLSATPYSEDQFR